MKAPALVLGAALALGCTAENSDPCYQTPGLCDDAGQAIPDSDVSTDGESKPDIGVVVDFGGDAMAVVDADVDSGVDVGVKADQGIEIDAGLNPDAMTADAAIQPDSSIEPDAAPERPCSVQIVSLESRGAVDRTMEVFCSEGLNRQIGAHEGDIVYGNGNICGVDGMPTAWGLMDVQHTVILEALGDCDNVAVNLGTRENVPTGEDPAEGTAAEFDANGLLRIEADDFGAGADNDGDGDTDRQSGSTVVRLHRP